jgi:hypothetical protein
MPASNYNPLVGCMALPHDCANGSDFDWTPLRDNGRVDTSSPADTTNPLEHSHPQGEKHTRRHKRTTHKKTTLQQRRGRKAGQL